MIILSVIIPVFNKELYIDACINSILNQSFKSFELILVNDGSTDRSGARCSYYAALDDRIKVIEQTNAGVSSARNVGLAMAKGSYIGFVDSDDTIEPDMYSLLIANAIKTNADISVCGIAIIRDNVKNTRSVLGIQKILTHSEALSSFLKGELYHNVNNKIYKAEILRKIRFEGIIYEDILFVCKAILKAQLTIFDSSIKYNYILRSNSTSIAGFNKNYLETVAVSAELVDLVVVNDRGCLAEAMEFDVMANISLLNMLLLLKDQQTYLFAHKQVLDTLWSYDQFIRNSVVVRSKHKYAWKLFTWSPRLYKYAMWAYCNIVGAELIKRIK